MTGSLLEVVQAMVRESGKPAKALAEELGKPYSTLMRELRAGGKGAKLGAETLLPLMQACRSVMPLRYLAARLGCRVVALEEAATEKSSLHEELLDSHDALARYHRAIRNQEPLERVAELRELVLRQVQEDFSAYRNKLASPDA